MKKLILFISVLITFNIFAVEHYIEKSKALDCNLEQTIYSGPMASSICAKKGECYKIKEFNYNCSYAKIVGDTYLKEQTQSCADEIGCEAMFQILICENNGFEKIKNIDLLQVYCAKFVKEHIRADEGKKAIHLAEKAQAKTDKKAELDEMKGYLSDINDDTNLKPYLKKILKKLVRDLK